jgi:phytoene synthase
MIPQSDIEMFRELLRGGSKSFHAASRVLPNSVREPAAAVYAFCRLADDAIDTGPDARIALSDLKNRLDRIYRGVPERSATDRAFAAVVKHFAIPRAVPAALIEGFAWDAEGRRYETIADLHAYAVRVAGTVGIMMSLLMRQRDPAVLARAADLGVAMQLTNIARDVGEDARAGRLYLPLQWLRGAEIDPDTFVSRPQFSIALGEVTRRLLEDAERLYERSRAGIACLPLQCRPSIHAARLLYAEIGREVERRNFDSVSQRAVVSGGRKAMLVLQGCAASLMPAFGTDAPALPQARTLVAKAAGVIPGSAQAPTPWWRFDQRFVRVLELFARLSEADELKRINARMQS